MLIGYFESIGNMLVVGLVLCLAFRTHAFNLVNATLKTSNGKFRGVNLTGINLNNFAENVTYIKVVKGVIPELEEKSVDGLRYLKTLCLKGRKLGKLQPGCFQNLPNLTTLNLGTNYLETIDEHVFNNLPVVELFLNKNKIKIIHSRAFHGMTQLEILRLNSNRLNAWDSLWVKNVAKLSMIFCKRNNLSEIPHNAFQHLMVKENVGLYFSKNSIRKIHQNAFLGFKTINKVIFDRNQLQDLDLGLFQGVEKIGEYPNIIN